MPGKKASTEFSCVLCTARKVRCNKAKPCQNCVKAGADCEVAPPPPPRRRKRKLGERDLVKKLAKYEELLLKNGFDLSEAEDDSQPFKSDRNAKSSNVTIESDQYHREFESASNILFGDVAETDHGRKSFHKAFDAVFDCSNSFPFAIGPPSNVDLTDMHPTGMQILQLWQTYLDNVDPLLKLTHAPTLQTRIMEASRRISSRLSIEKNFEALLFNIYFISINSLTEAQCVEHFNATKTSLQAQYHVTSQQALLNANLMRTVDLTVVQAFILHLTSIRNFVDPRTHYVLIGIAVRIAIRLGLHRDGMQLNLSPFDTEQRRRLWFNLVALDARIAETTGATVTAISTPRADCNRPLNLEDSALHIHAKNPFQASTGATEMVFCLARYEVVSTAAPDGIGTLPTLSTNTSDQRLHDGASGNGPQGLQIRLEDYANYVEATYLQTLDPSIPLHLFTILMTRQNLRKVLLIANVATILKGPSASSEELRRWAFGESLRLLEDDNTLQSTLSMQRWLWYTHMHFPFPAYMFLVHELKTRCVGEESARAWEAMDRNHRLRGLVGPGKKGSPMHIAYGKHFLSAWKARVQAEGQRGRILQTPELISLVQQIHQLPQPQGEREHPAEPSLATGLPNDPLMWQGWYDSYGRDDLDPLASFGDIASMEYVIPSLM